MKTYRCTITAISALAFAVPAIADNTPPAPTTPSAQQQCRTERAQMGAATFAQTYGTNKHHTNAFGKCVSKRSKATDDAASAAQGNASKQCDTEEAADPAAFKAKYGSGKKGANAHGKCVSVQAKAQNDKS